VIGLGQRAVGPGRRDLERVALPNCAQVPGDALAHGEGDTVRMVDEQPDERVAHDLREQHIDLGLCLGQARLDLGLNGGHG
jgi:hypothetical protein